MAVNSNNLSAGHRRMLLLHRDYENARCGVCSQNCPKRMRYLVPSYRFSSRNSGDCIRPHREWMHCCNYMYQLRDSPAWAHTV